MGVRAPLSRAIVRVAAATLAVAMAACGDAPTEPASGGDRRDPLGAYAGFDVSRYPGDAAMRAWKTSSPFVWTGYYLKAPCHKTDTSWVGSYRTLSAMGWGTAVIYVGQQDWRYIPSLAPLGSRVDAESQLPALGSRLSATARAERPRPSAERRAWSAVTQEPTLCSASVLTIPEGTIEAADAVEKTLRDGVPPGSTIFLDIEHVTVVSPELLAYYRAWVTGIDVDGRFRPGVYVSKSNIAIFRDSTRAMYARQGRSEATLPAFWVAWWSSPTFSVASRPRDSGYDYAAVWQGKGQTSQSYGGTTLGVDLNVASRPDPSAPTTALVAR